MLLTVGRRFRAVLGMAAVLGLVATVSVMGRAETGSASVGAQSGISSDWLGALNSYRIQTGLAPLAVNGSWSYGAFLHSRYVLCSGHFDHFQRPHAAYTPQGDHAARHSNIAAGPAGRDGRQWIEGWLAAPFHAINMLDPRLTTVGFGIAETGAGDECNGRAPWSAAAALDVLTGVDYRRPLQNLAFPSTGTRLPLQRFLGETPDPRTSCPGGAGAWQGVPLIGMFTVAPTAPAAYIAGPSGALEVCIVTQSNYWNADPNAQATARSIMASHNSIVVIPRWPLQTGVHHFVAVARPGVVVDSWFTVVPEGT